MSDTLQWVRDAIFYQIMPDRFANGDPIGDPKGVRPWGRRPTRRNFFGGDLAGIRQRLPYLQDLGVTALYLTPVFTSPSNHKYDTADYFQVDPAFGGNEALRALVTAVHTAGMRIVLDGVFNHTGDLFWAFRSVVEEGKDSPYTGWYSFDSLPVRLQPPNYRACGGAHFLPRLNTENPEVREYLYRVGRFWISEFDVDGWRLDVPWEVGHEFWQGFRSAVKAVKPDAYLVGESWGNAMPWLAGDQFDGVTHYPLRELLIRFFVQQAINAATFDRELQTLRDAYPDHVRGNLLTLLGSHDTPRIRTVADGRTGPVKAALVFLFTYEGAPMIYYGDEVGLEGGPDPDCRRCMPWGDAVWDGEQHALLTRLGRVRQAHPALRRGDFTMLACQERTFVFSRQYNADVVVVAINAGFQAEALLLQPPAPARGWRDLLSDAVLPCDWGGRLRLDLPALGYAVLAPEPGAAT